MKQKWIRLLTPLAVVLGMVLALPMFGSALGNLDLDADCSLKVNLTSSEEILKDLQNVKVIVDIYKVADAVPLTANGFTYDAYEFSALGAYAVESLDFEKPDLTLSEEKGWQQWQAEAQKAAKIALADDAEDVEHWGNVTIDMKNESKPGDLIAPLDPGLYLLIVHGEGLEKEDYVKTLKESVTDEELGIEKAAGSLVTIAYSDEYEYSFLPELVALPNKAAVPGQPGLPPGQLVSSAADNGAWLYDYEIYLKPGRELRYGSLEIVKDLPEYETWDYTVEEATFVFQVEAERDEKKVYSDVVSLTFNQAGEKRVRIEDKIPAGAVVTVTEVYSGSSYTVQGSPVQRETIRAAEVVSVSFTNIYDKNQRSGHGIINHFEPEEDAAGGWIYGWSSADDSLGLPVTAPGQTETNPEATSSPAPEESGQGSQAEPEQETGATAEPETSSAE